MCPAELFPKQNGLDHPKLNWGIDEPKVDRNNDPESSSHEAVHFSTTTRERARLIAGILISGLGSVQDKVRRQERSADA